jgi:GNAT superfamily N-acetyltransferase
MPDNVVSVALRPEGPMDEAFLLEVYAGTRQEELEATGWPAAMREAFVKMQFKAQRQGYYTTFPRAEFSIVLSDGQPVGRIVIDRAEDQIRLVDIALLPSYRGRGVGAILLQGLMREAAAVRKPLRLSVIKGQRAGRWYQRLGFVKTGEDSLRNQMEWRGDQLPPNNPKPCEPA